MHSLNIFSDLLSNKTTDLQKSISIISKSICGALVIIRNPKKELKKEILLNRILQMKKY